MRKLWVLLLVLGLSAVAPEAAHSQVLFLDPTPIALYYWDTGTNMFTKCPNTSTAHPYASTPQAYELEGFNSGLGQWTPQTACPGGGSGGTVSIQHNGTPVAIQSILNFDDTTPAPPAGKVGVTFQTDGTGKVSAFVPGVGLQTQIVPPIAGQYIVIYPTIFGATCTHGSTCTVPPTAPGATPFAAVNSGPHNSIDYTEATASFGGYSLPAGFSGTITSIYGYSSSVNVGQIANALECTWAGGPTINMLTSPAVGTAAVAMTGLTSAGIPSFSCTDTNWGSSVFTAPFINSFASTSPMALIVYYTGSAPAANNALQIAYPLTFINNVLGISPTAPFPGLYELPYTIATGPDQLPTSASFPVVPVIGAVYNVIDGASSSDCTTGHGSTQVWCQFNGSTYVALPGGGGGGATLPFPGIVYGTSASAGRVATTNDITALLGPPLYANNFTGANEGAKINACLTQVRANGGGICDATILLDNNTSAAITSEIQVGDVANANITVELILPSRFTMVININDSTKCGMRVFNRGIVQGGGIGGGGTQAFLQVGSGAVLQGALCTDTSDSTAQNYVRIVGVSAFNPASGTTTHLVDLEDLGDQSEYGNSYANSWAGNTMYFANICCGFWFHDLQAFGSNPGDSTQGGDALYLGGYGYGAIYSSTFNRPSNSHYNINIQGSWNLTCFNCYEEGNTADTTPMNYLGTLSTGTSFIGSEMNPCLGGGCRVVGKYSVYNASGYNYAIIASIGGNYPGDPMVYDNNVGRVTCTSAGQRNLAPSCFGGPDASYFENINANTINAETVTIPLMLSVGGNTTGTIILPGGGEVIPFGGGSSGTEINLDSTGGPSMYALASRYALAYVQANNQYLTGTLAGDYLSGDPLGRFLMSSDQTSIGSYFSGSSGGRWTFNNAPVFASITGSTQCLQVNSSGVPSGSGATCGSGAGTVTDGSGTTTAGIIPESTTSAHVLDYASNLAIVAGQLQYSGTGGMSIAGSTHGIVLPAGTAVAGATGKVVYGVDASVGYAEVNENNSGLSRICTAANGLCAPATLPLSCQPGIGDGLNAIPAGTYLTTTCRNETGLTWTITAIRCVSDNSGSSTCAVTNGAGTSLLSSAITATPTYANGTQSGTTTIASGDYLKVTYVADGSSKQIGIDVAGTY